ncbi:hypothetical protein ASPFODRAFT_208312 [Aspergillus luchuensis CBS 106.47]|uniref:Uncharacterized protein n=1 Tax=Aspergillus luchuensis (strain CBS 106.47) TaxID=1137211 RepID=A0A1M3TEF8_ASPLC|nr:hypothetical protein ASPFODRAFT_208312 [Aspergillus luchuensis CBS 106.47]
MTTSVSVQVLASPNTAKALGGTQWTAEPAYRTIAGTKPWALGIVGWFQGSAFLFTTGILHYQWARNPRALQEPTNKAIAIILNAALWASSAWYFKHGINENGWAVGAAAAWQAWSVVRAWLKY